MQFHRVSRLTKALAKTAATPRLIKALWHIQKTLTALGMAPPFMEISEEQPKLSPSRERTLLCAIRAYDAVQYELSRREIVVESLESTPITVEASFETKPRTVWMHLWEKLDGSFQSYTERRVWTPHDGGRWAVTYDRALQLSYAQTRAGEPIRIDITIPGPPGLMVIVEDAVIRLIADDIGSLRERLDVDIAVYGPEPIALRLNEFFAIRAGSNSWFVKSHGTIRVTDE
jgi:hypothetical protein